MLFAYFLQAQKLLALVWTTLNSTFADNSSTTLIPRLLNSTAPSPTDSGEKRFTFAGVDLDSSVSITALGFSL